MNGDLLPDLCNSDGDNIENERFQLLDFDRSNAAFGPNSGIVEWRNSCLTSR